MPLNTASEVISLARQLEEDCAKFYELLAQRYLKDGETFLSLAEESRKNIVQVERAYYGVITDALEGCFAFSINQNEYLFSAELSEKISYTKVLGWAIDMEKKIGEFYSDAGEQSKSLMADVPRAFAMMAKKRGGRISILELFLSKEA